jgi:hypothetical protein
MARRTFYRLQLCRTEIGKDPMDATGKTNMPMIVERGVYLQANGDDVEFFGYGHALNRAAELNAELRSRNQRHLRWVPVEKGQEKQQSLVG